MGPLTTVRGTPALAAAADASAAPVVPPMYTAATSAPIWRASAMPADSAGPAPGPGLSATSTLGFRVLTMPLANRTPHPRSAHVRRSAPVEGCRPGPS